MRPANNNIVHVQIYSYKDNLLLQHSKKKKKSISDFLANLLQKPCTKLMAGGFLQVTSLRKTAMSRGGSEAQTWKHFWIVPVTLPPPAGRWKMITSLRQVASCSFLSRRCQMWQIIRGGILVWSFVCWDWSVSSKLIYFQISSWTGTKVERPVFYPPKHSA